jgi:hypothetical protein
MIDVHHHRLPPGDVESLDIRDFNVHQHDDVDDMNFLPMDVVEIPLFIPNTHKEIHQKPSKTVHQAHPVARVQIANPFDPWDAYFLAKDLDYYEVRLLVSASTTMPVHFEEIALWLNSPAIRGKMIAATKDPCKVLPPGYFVAQTYTIG